MPCTRTIVTMIGLALAGATAVTGVGEGHAESDSAPPAPAATSAAAAFGARPATALGITAARRQLHEFDVAGDGPARVLATVAEGDIVDVERAPDGTVYYAYVIGDTQHILHVANGSHRVVAEGWAPAVSPDGRRLAYAYHPSVAGLCAGDGIAVLEMATGHERRFPGPDPDPGAGGCPETDGVIDGISWSPDSRRLLFGDGLSPRILDTATAHALADAVPLDDRRPYSHPAWLADGRVAVIERAGASGVRVMVVDPHTRRASEFAPAAWAEGDARGLDADASGRHLLVSLGGPGAAGTTAPSGPAADRPARIFMLAEGAEPEELNQPYRIAVW